MGRPKNKEEYRAELAETFSNILEEKGLSWRKEWNGKGGGAPHNGVTKATYVEYWYPYDVTNKKVMTWEDYKNDLANGRREKEFTLAIREKPETLIKAMKDAQAAANHIDYKAGLITEKEYEKACGAGMEVKQKGREMER